MSKNHVETMTVAEFKKQKPSKYRNVRVEIDGESFDSKREAKRIGELRLLEQAGKIKGLKRQVTFPLTVCGQRVGRYVADAAYFENGLMVVEDVKGYRDPKSPVYRLFKLKIALVKAIYGYTVVEV